MNNNSELKYLNKKFKNNDNEWFTVIEYFNSKNITVQFDDGTKKFNQQAGHINRGDIKSTNSKFLIPTIFEIGYIGIGKYNSKHFVYIIWQSMLRRCYDKNYQLKQQTYIDCLVDSNWHNFQNFALWYEENYEEGFVLDKDILFKGNKIYSSETCCFVPQEINNLFIKQQSKRGEYPIGVHFAKDRNKFVAQLNINGINKNLGSFNTPQEAFQIYKIAKEKYIKEIANKWKDKISEKVYLVMYNYQVEITD